MIRRIITIDEEKCKKDIPLDIYTISPDGQII